MLVLLLSALVGCALATDYDPFSYTNCGSAADPIQVQFVTVTPSPVVFGSNVTATAKVSVGQAITNQTAGSLTFSVEKHIGIWVPIPCSEIPGGCEYSNFCDVVTNPGPVVCGLLSSLGLPCQCPIAAKTYSVNKVSLGPVPQPPSSLSWLADGSFKVTFQLNDKSGKRLICGTIVDSAKGSK